MNLKTNINSECRLIYAFGNINNVPLVPVPTPEVSGEIGNSVYRPGINQPELLSNVQHRIDQLPDAQMQMLKRFGPADVQINGIVSLNALEKSKTQLPVNTEMRDGPESFIRQPDGSYLYLNGRQPGKNGGSWQKLTEQQMAQRQTYRQNQNDVQRLFKGQPIGTEKVQDGLARLAEFLAQFIALLIQFCKKLSDTLDKELAKNKFGQTTTEAVNKQLLDLSDREKSIKDNLNGPDGKKLSDAERKKLKQEMEQIAQKKKELEKQRQEIATAQRDSLNSFGQGKEMFNTLGLQPSLQRKSGTMSLAGNPQAANYLKSDPAIKNNQKIDIKGNRITVPMNGEQLNPVLMSLKNYWESV